MFLHLHEKFSNSFRLLSGIVLCSDSEYVVLSPVTSNFVEQGKIIEKIMKCCGDNINTYVYKAVAIFNFCSGDVVFVCIT